MRTFLLLLIITTFLFSCERNNTETPPKDDPSNSKTILDSIAVLSLVFDSERTAWIGTFSQGLVKYSLTETVIFDSSNSLLTNDPIRDIAVDSKDNIWIGKDKGIEIMEITKQ